jgi:group II intron reverse transcriptase/maturase
VQTAFLLILEPIFEADFADSSYGFRPGKSAHDAVREIYKYLNWGCVEVYDVDLEKYFDTVDHGKLMKLVARRIMDAQILHVIKQWLSCGYVEEGQHRQSAQGTPHGGVISPLLANIYLNPVDQAFKRERLGNISRGSIHLVRYADDMVIMAQESGEIPGDGTEIHPPLDTPSCEGAGRTFESLPARMDGLFPAWTWIGDVPRAGSFCEFTSPACNLATQR